MRKRTIDPVPVLVAIAVALVFGVTACGNDVVEEGSPQSDDTLPPVVDGYEHPTGADEVVISYAEVGGFVPIQYAFQQIPNLLVSGDGRSFTPGAQIAIYPGPLLPAMETQTISEAGIQTLLAAADEAGLFADVEYEAPTNIADASTAQVIINVNGATYIHEAYALGLSTPDGGEETSPEREALAGFVAELGDLSSLTGADELDDKEMFRPSDYGIEGVVVDDVSAYGADGIDPTVVDWPSDASVTLNDAIVCTRIPAADVETLFADANQLTFFAEDGVTYQVLARPILPGGDCA